MIRHPRDSQRSRVYAAEQSLRWHYTEVHTAPDWLAWAQNYCNRIVASRWWAKNIGRGWTVELRPIKGRRAFYRGAGVIDLPKSRANPATLLHELGHHGTPVLSHGPHFTSLHLRLVRRWLGRAAWRELRQAYREHSVHYRAPNGTGRKHGSEA